MSSDQYFTAIEKALAELNERRTRWAEMADEYYNKPVLDAEQRIYAEKADIRAFCYTEAVRVIEDQLRIAGIKE